MMRRMGIRMPLRSKITAVAAALIITLFSLVISLVCSIPNVKAETSGTVTLHVYDPQQDYSGFAAWIWVKGAGGVEYNLQSTPLPDEGFSKSYETGGQTVTNTAHVFQLTFSEAQIVSLKSGIDMGLLVCRSKGSSSGDFWARYEKETSDVFVSLKTAFDDNNHADVYYLRKDTVAYTNLEDAKMALEKVTGARFTEKTNSSVTIAFEATSPITATTDVILESSVAVLQKVKAVPDAGNAFTAKATFTALKSSNFDFAETYIIKVGDIPTGAEVAKTMLMDDPGFIAQFESVDTQNLEFGAISDAQNTTFRVWAPFASSVRVNLYKSGTGGDAYYAPVMEKRVPQGGKWGGVWEYTCQRCVGDYYTYAIVNNGVTTETIDPYAKACGANGARGMVVDLDETDPDGWSGDSFLYASSPKAADTPVVWELHVKDFSASPDSGMKYKGKYLAFTEEDTTVPGTALKTGVNYLKDLGITYVHLNPVYDFATVDETEMTTADDTKDVFNWGYDPQNYNIPEGSYSTDPSNGEVRINEFKQMVMALHNAGIGIIMDVVYNHTYSTSGQALHDTVPSYYHRFTKDGSFTDGSGCGNETASERAMMRKYIVESIVYWATEYHIDGFRFDLMGIHDKVTMEAVRTALDAIDGGNGKKLLLYGEPWSADSGDYFPQSYKTRVSATQTAIAGAGKYTSNAGNNLVKNMFSNNKLGQLSSRIAVFNGTGRDGLRGNNDPGNGWVNGAEGTSYAAVQKMLEGACGSSGSGMSLSSGSQNVAYASAHDNYTLWDQMVGKQAGKETPLFYSNLINSYAKQCQTASSAYLMSSGISFMLAGEEMGRTKYGNHNSYNSPTKVNQIVWARQEEFSSMVEHYKRVIAVRKAYGTAFFSYAASVSASYCYGDFTGTTSDGAIVFTRKNGTVKLVCIFNPTSTAKTVSSTGLPVALNGLNVYVNGGTVRNSKNNAASISVPAKCTAILGSIELN